MDYYGNADNNIHFGDNTDQQIEGYAGIDLLRGAGGDDTIDGGSGPDSLYGDSGNDVIRGGDGDDLLRGGRGNDTLSGGIGTDMLHGDRGNDRLEATGEGIRSYATNFLYGGPGNDTLVGSLGADIMIGGDGNDLLIGSQGPDVMIGNGGTLSYQDSPRGVTIMRHSIESLYDIVPGYKYKNPVTYVGGGHAKDDTIDLDSFQTIVGSSHSDRIYITTGNKSIYGGPGNDHLMGNSGIHLYGNAGDDQLYMTNGSGYTRMYGGIGSDTFHFDRHRGAVIIEDFTPDEGDKIVFMDPDIDEADIHRMLGESKGNRLDLTYLQSGNIGFIELRGDITVADLTIDDFDVWTG